ncbi:MAG: hypothetical protein ACUVQZ_07295 [Candidatus Caldatribacteriaceae bacterium]
MEPDKQEIFDLLEYFYQITLAVKRAVDRGSWENLSGHLEERQNLIERLENFAEFLEGSDREKALSILLKVVRLDEEIRATVKYLVNQDLLQLKEKREKLSALQHFREHMDSSLSPRFLEKKG